MNAVTGAFGYIGRAITAKLLESGEPVRTVTTHPSKPSPFGDAVAAFPYDFDQPQRLAEHLMGSRTLFNTYWIRFPHGAETFESALENTGVLLEAARAAGVERVVHISVTRANAESDLPYYAGKAAQEQLVRESRLPYAILRPSLVFGPGDILVNNMAWLMRRFPLFPVFGKGDYSLEPIYLLDLADLAYVAGQRTEDVEWDAVGPETFTFKHFLTLLAEEISPSTSLVHVPPSLGLALGWLLGRLLGDILLTSDELKGLMDECLTSDDPPRGKTRFSRWLEIAGDSIGTDYHSELRRHFYWDSGRRIT